MKRLNTKIFIFLSLWLLYGASSLPAAGSDETKTAGADHIFAGGNFQAGILDGVTVTADGLTLAPQATTGRYTSAIIEAPLQFNAVVPQWTASIPEAAGLAIRLRTGTADGRWSSYYPIHENHDWMLPGDPDVVGQMISVPATDVTHTRLQISVGFSRYEGETPAVLEKLRLTFIDSSGGPTAAELVARQASLDQDKAERPEDGYPKPPIVSRQVWCTDPACTYSNGLTYEPVTHLIVHHTVSDNNNSDWAAVVRAIWYFHTFTRGWGDIGYNYLADMDGVLYEGHLGGDDVVGVHAGDANSGSMGLALIGTFTSASQNPPGITPPPEMLDSAVELMAWKADQKGIDVYDAGYLPYMHWGLPHLMGHRDVYGTTLCPGDLAHEQLPWMRDEVANRIGFVSPHQYVDELSDAFTMSNATWYTPPGGCGFNGHAYYAWSTTSPANSNNWGEWRPVLENPGTYEVEVYAPYCITGAYETHGATYTINHAQGSDTVVVSHEDNVGAWMSLGTFDFYSGADNFVRLTNLTTTDNGLGVWFDAIRLRLLMPQISISNQYPTAAAWLQDRTVPFSWNLSNPESVDNMRLEAATDEAFSDMVFTQTLVGATTAYSHTFDLDYARLYWHIVLTTTQGSTIASLPTYFGIDIAAPTSAVYGIYALEGGDYSIIWAGDDETSGIASYNIDYLAEGDATWTRWFTDTNQTGAPFIPPDGRVYWFRSQATDWAGNLEPLHLVGDKSTADAVQLYRVIMLPQISHQMSPAVAALTHRQTAGK